MYIVHVTKQLLATLWNWPGQSESETEKKELTDTLRSSFLHSSVLLGPLEISGWMQVCSRLARMLMLGGEGEKERRWRGEVNQTTSYQMHFPSSPSLPLPPFLTVSQRRMCVSAHVQSGRSACEYVRQSRSLESFCEK